VKDDILIIMDRIAVLRGGPSEEYDVSLRTGQQVMAALRELGHAPKDVVISKRGEWLDGGMVRRPEQTLQAVDKVFVALHGTYGEDGQVQRLLERVKVPYTGTAALASAVGFNKHLTRHTLSSLNINFPNQRRLTREEYHALDLPYDLSGLFEEVGSELFVKPVTGGSSIGARYVPNVQTLAMALADLFQFYEQILIEEFIRGREATVGVINDFRGGRLYALPVVEIVPPSGKPLFSYEDKYNNTTSEIVPGRFSYGEKSSLSDVARMVHEVVGCRQYSRSDFIVRDGEVYFLEVNTHPGLTAESLFPKAAAAVGLSFPLLIKHLIETV
jgi:D-alanine-D-alanine ligase